MYIFSHGPAPCFPVKSLVFIGEIEVNEVLTKDYNLLKYRK
jgi:hypothetical protein